MSVIDRAVSFLVDLATDNSHGYDQQYRWGERGDYDCSSSTITAFERAGVPVKTKYGATYTGNMKTAFVNAGFKAIKYVKSLELVKGDVLLNEVHHVVVYIGNGQVVTASLNEKGTTMGGKAGDQTSREIYIRDFYIPSYGWDWVLRYEGDSSVEGNPYPVPTMTLKQGMVGAEIRWLQWELVQAGADIAIDSHFGSKTYEALRAFQRAYGGLEIDGICGRMSREALIINTTKIIDTTPKNPYKHSQITLKRGSKNTSVRWLQWELNHRINAGLQEDGSFGKLTEQKVIEFQKMVFPNQPNEHDGIVGARTRAKLES